MKRFFVYTRGRTGSSALVDDLNQHPQIVCHQELFSPQKVSERVPYSDIYYLSWIEKVKDQSIDAYWRYLDALARDQHATVNGMKILLNQFDAMKPYGIENVVWNTDIKVIYLTRDPVCEAISGHLARTRNIFNINRHYHDKFYVENLKSLAPVRIDPLIIDREVDYIFYWANKLTDFIKTVTNPVLVMSYEKYFGHKKDAYEELLDFLSVSPASPPEENRFLKVTKPGWKGDIENIDEIIKYLEARGRDLSVAYSFLATGGY